MVCDLASSRDGTLLGPKRKSAAEKQVVNIIMTNPDLLYADEWALPRYGPLSITTMICALFEKHYGFELKYEQFGKPIKSSFDFTEKYVRERA